MKEQDPSICPQFEGCDAPLCPLDKELKSRCWYSDEPVCRSAKHGAGIRWIRKQRSIVKRQTKSWLDRPVSYQELYDASRKRKVSQASIDALKKYRFS